MHKCYFFFEKKKKNENLAQKFNFSTIAEAWSGPNNLLFMIIAPEYCKMRYLWTISTFRAFACILLTKDNKVSYQWKAFWGLQNSWNEKFLEKCEIYYPRQYFAVEYCSYLTYSSGLNSEVFWSFGIKLGGLNSEIRGGLNSDLV